MFTTRPELCGTFAAVSSTHYLASASAFAVLEEGGNAFDAAVAGGLVLQVVEPHLNGPGGDVPMIIRTPGAEPAVLCGQGVAPAGASITAYSAEGLTTVPGTGLLAPAVPGAVPAWITLLRDYGTRTPRQVARFALDYAEHGHPILAAACETIERVARYFASSWPTSAAQWTPGGRVPAAGELVGNRPWAATLHRLCTAAEAAGADRVVQCDAFLRAWSSGFVAESIERFVRTPVPDSSGQAHAGVLTAADMDAWSPTYEAGVSYDWRGRRLTKCGPWSQGPVLLQQLALLDPLLDDTAAPRPPRGQRTQAALSTWTAELIHTCVEVTKLAFADRDAYYGDSGDDLLDIAQLLDPGYLAARRALVGEEASRALRPGACGGRTPRFPAAVRELAAAAPPIGAGEPTTASNGQPRGDTCHLDIVDRWGNAVSATPSGGWLQSSPYIPDLGFCLGTRLQMCWLEPGLPSSLEPGRRPRTTLSPSLAVDLDTDATTAFGTPGGDQQDQWQLVFWLAHTVLGLDLQAAIDAPSWHSEAVISSFEPRGWTPGALVAESRLGEPVLDELRTRGHDVRTAGEWALGRLGAAKHDGAAGTVSAAASPRGMQGYAHVR